MSAASFLRKLIGAGRGGMDRRTEELLSLCSALLSESGEYASTALAREALVAYEALDERSRDEFFEALARQYSPSPESVGRAASAYQSNPTSETRTRLEGA